MVTSTSGWTIPAEKPCITRPKIRKSMDGPAAQTIPPAAKSTSTTMNATRRPSHPTIHRFNNWLAVIVARYAVARNCARPWPTPNAPITSGTATFTMVPESTIVDDATMPVPVTSRRSRRVATRSAGMARLLTGHAGGGAARGSREGPGARASTGRRPGPGSHPSRHPEPGAVAACAGRFRTEESRDDRAGGHVTGLAEGTRPVPRPGSRIARAGGRISRGRQC